MTNYTIETSQDSYNSYLFLHVRYGDEPSVPVEYCFAPMGEKPIIWYPTPFQSVNIRRGDVCRLVTEWLDEVEA